MKNHRTLGVVPHIYCTRASSMSNPVPNNALNPAPFGRWTLRDKAAQRRLAPR